MPIYPARAQPYVTKGEMRALLEQALRGLRDYRSLILSDYDNGRRSPNQTVAHLTGGKLDPLIDDIEDALQRAPRRHVGRPRGS